MARTSWGAGTPITAEFMTAVGSPKITGLPEDGHLDLLTNAQFDQAPGNVVFDFYERSNRLKASRDVAGGLTLRIAAGTIQAPSGALIQFPSQTVNLPNNLISFITIGPDGSIINTPTNPAAGVRVARVTTGSGQITAIDDLRFDALWLPNVNSLDVFGGSSTTDYTAPLGVTTVSGVITCRNFTVPVGATLDVDRTLTVRASGSVTINGIIRTLTRPISYAGNTLVNLMVTTGNERVDIGAAPGANRNGVTVTNRQKPSEYAGGSTCALAGSTVASNQATGITFDVSSTKVVMTPGTSGANVTIHAAGPVVLSGTSQVNCSATNTTTPTINPTSLISLAHPISGLQTTNWSISLFVYPPQATAGTFVCQSSTSVTVDAGAQIYTRGADSAQSRQLSHVSTAPGVFPVVDSIRIGGGGGGAVHFQAPIVSSSPSAVISTLGGTTLTSGSGGLVDGPGSSGTGFIASTLNQATNGLITTSLTPPVEF